MRLISCAINGFGKYRNQRIDFGDGIFSFYEANGSGKSTLAAYIKAMFYGMGPNSEKSKFNDRRHYIPFDGGEYGGSIRFLYNKKDYVISRIFDKKGTGAHDSLEVSRGGVKTDELGKCPGEKIFDIDADSFERILFMSSGDMQLSSTESMKSKLSGVIEGESGGVKLDDAVGRLTKKKKEYTTRKSGLIDETIRMRDELDARLHNIDGINAALPGKYRELEKIERELEQLNGEIRSEGAKETLETKWKTYDGYLSDADSQKSEIEKIERKYPRGVPSTDQAKEYLEYSRTLKELNAAMEKSPFTNEDEIRLRELGGEFRGGVPDSGRLAQIGDDIRREGVLESEIGSAESRMTSPDEALTRKFAGREPGHDVLEELDRLTEEYRLSDSAANAAPPAGAHAPSDKRKKGSRGVTAAVLTVLAAICVIAGVACFFVSVSVAVPIVLIAAGVVLLFVAGFMYLNGRISSGNGVTYVSPEAEENRRKADGCRDRIGAIIMPYGYDPGIGVSAAAELFKRDFSVYCAAKKNADGIRLSIEEMTAERDECVRRINGAFAAYSLKEGGYMERLGRLRSDVDEYTRLSARKRSSEEAYGQTSGKLKATRDRMDAFRRAFCITPDAGADDIYEDASRYWSAKKRYEELSQRAGRYMSENNLVTRPAAGGRSAEELEKRQKELNKMRANRENEIKDCEQDVEAEGELRKKYDECTENLEKYNRQVGILDKTINALKAADAVLKEKYINPLGESFRMYTDKLSAVIGERVFIDNNLNVKFECGAGVMEEEYMSDGQKSLCMLCFRLAMTDNMYITDKPFLIMDDPFVSLDEKHLALAKKLLSDISKEHQIIYFTCHESRRIQ